MAISASHLLWMCLSFVGHVSAFGLLQSTIAHYAIRGTLNIECGPHRRKAPLDLFDRPSELPWIEVNSSIFMDPMFNSRSNSRCNWFFARVFCLPTWIFQSLCLFVVCSACVFQIVRSKCVVSCPALDARTILTVFSERQIGCRFNSIRLSTLFGNIRYTLPTVSKHFEAHVCVRLSGKLQIPEYTERYTLICNIPSATWNVRLSKTVRSDCTLMTMKLSNG